jgi:cytochrome c oxidase subunit 3
MTALHALHMIIGIGLVTWLIVKSYEQPYRPSYYTPVDVTGLYWHFVDIIWIYLYPLLYLVDRHSN